MARRTRPALVHVTAIFLLMTMEGLAADGAAPPSTSGLRPEERPEEDCTPAAAAAPPTAEPLFSFGILADVQYADLPDGTGDLPRVQRYRESPAKLAAALAEFRNATPPLAFVLHLGDLINGNQGGQALTDAELEAIAGVFDEGLAGEVRAAHLLGNHDASVPRAAFLDRLRFPSANESLVGYYSLALPASWRLLVLDTNELSLHSGLPPGSAAVREAQEYWAAHPQSAAEPQMSDWNGGITRAQLAWVQEELAAAEAAGERVVVASHNPLSPGAGPDNHLAWNWREIEAALLASPAFALALNGHWHPGGFVCRGGRGWVGVQAVLEAPTGGNAFAVASVWPDRVVIDGRGSDVPSRVLALPPPARPAD